jgi:hypothetical protein
MRVGIGSDSWQRAKVYQNLVITVLVKKGGEKNAQRR